MTFSARHRSRTLIHASLLLVTTATSTAVADVPSRLTEILAPESLFTRQDCLGPCACVSPPHSGPLLGSIVLRLNHTDQWTAYYDVVDVNLVAQPDTLAVVHYSGTGTYEHGGDFALTHRLQLDLIARTDPATPVEHYDSGTVVITSQGSHPFPGIDITVTTGVVGCTRRTMHIAADAVVNCPGDFNGDGTVSVQDIFDFLGSYFTNDRRADVNADGAVSVQDIFDFLADYFGPC